MPKAEVNGIELFYEVTGRGTTVVFCHDAAGNHLSWWQQVPEFSKHYRCVTYDQRGFGQSLESPGGPGAAALVEDLAGLLNHLGIRDVLLVCQSLGGLAGMGFALKYPSRVKALVLSGSHGEVIDAATRQRAGQLREHAGAGKDPLSFSVSDKLQRDRPTVFFLHKEIMDLNQPPPADYFQELNGMSPPPKVLLQKFAFPTLFLVGEEDVLTPPEVIEIAQRQVPNSRLVKIPSSGHSPYFERPEIFNQAVLAFLEEAQRPRLYP